MPYAPGASRARPPAPSGVAAARLVAIGAVAVVDDEGAEAVVGAGGERPDQTGAAQAAAGEIGRNRLALPETASRGLPSLWPVSTNSTPPLSRLDRTEVSARSPKRAYARALGKGRQVRPSAARPSKRPSHGATETTRPSLTNARSASACQEAAQSVGSSSEVSPLRASKGRPISDDLELVHLEGERRQPGGGDRGGRACDRHRHQLVDRRVRGLVEAERHRLLPSAVGRGRSGRRGARAGTPRGCPRRERLALVTKPPAWMSTPGASGTEPPRRRWPRTRARALRGCRRSLAGRAAPSRRASGSWPW